MLLSLELPQPVNAELTHEAQQEGVSETDHAALLVCLATALQQDTVPTPFQEAVQVFLEYHSLDASKVASAFKELIKVCLDAHEPGKISPRFQESLSKTTAYRDYALLKQWRNAGVHSAAEIPLDITSESVLTLNPLTDTTIQSAGRTDRETVPGNMGSTHQERNPERVAHVRAVRGKYAHTVTTSGAEELHWERERDREREEILMRGYQPSTILSIQAR